MKYRVTHPDGTVHEVDFTDGPKVQVGDLVYEDFTGENEQPHIWCSTAEKVKVLEADHRPALFGTVSFEVWLKDNFGDADYDYSQYEPI